MSKTVVKFQNIISVVCNKELDCITVIPRHVGTTLNNVRSTVLILIAVSGRCYGTKMRPQPLPFLFSIP